MASISSRNLVDAVLRVERMSFQDAGRVEPGRVHRGDSAAKDKAKPPAWSSRVMARTRERDSTGLAMTAVRPRHQNPGWPDPTLQRHPRP